MPKISWLKSQPPKAPRANPPDYTLDLFKRYQKALSLTNAQLAPLVGCRSEQAVKDKKASGTDRWNKTTILKWATVLRVPIDELSKALELDARRTAPPS